MHASELFREKTSRMLVLSFTCGCNRLHDLHCAIESQRLKTMAKRETAQGVNGRLSIALDQDNVAPGEIIRGMVRLGLLESIEARERESCSIR